MLRILSIALFFAREPLVPWSSKLTYVMFAGLLIAVISGTWTGAVAARKKRNYQAWFIIGFFLPIIGILIIQALPALSGENEKKQKTD